MAELREREQVHPAEVQEWRDWLQEHAATTDGVWLVSWKAHTGRPRLTYEQAVEQALCFGWVDSTARALDSDRTMLWFARRNPRSAWSRPNKLRIERLAAAGLLAPAGQRAVEVAKANGSWTLLDEVEDLIVPPDLAQAFADRPGAREHWDAFPRSARRGILEWIVQARRPQTRARRIEDTAAKAAVGERANQWPRT